MIKDKNDSKSNVIPWLFLALGLVQAAHSVEEVLTGLWRNFPVVTGFLHAGLSWVPVMTWSEQGFAAANLIVVALLLGFSPFPFQNKTWAWKVAGIVAGFEILNGLGHTGAALVSGGYFSGSITAVLLLFFGVLMLLQLRRKHAK